MNARPILGYVLLCAVYCVGCTAGSQQNVATSNTKATPANVVIDVKPTQTEVKQTDAKPAGKEIKVVDGPALKSVIPPDDAVLGGVLNDLATTLPKPEPPADAKESGTVTVEVLVNEKGEVRAASAVSGPQPLRSAAVAAARETRFDPPLKDGKPVKVAGVLNFDFGK